jgi:two-component sensor histidine kinase
MNPLDLSLASASPSRADDPGACPGPPASSEAVGAALDRLTRLAARLCEAPFATLVAVDAEGRQIWSRVGPAGDPWLDAPLARHLSGWERPLFTGDDPVAEVFGPASSTLRFQAIAPLITGDGRLVGVLRVADVRAHPPPTEDQRASLADLAALAAAAVASEMEIAELRGARAADRERAGLALRAAGMAAFDWDVAADRVLTTDRLQELIGGAGDQPSASAGQGLYANVHPDDREHLRAAVEEGLRTHRRYEHEHRMVRSADGRVIWVATTGVPVGGGDGEPIRIVGLAQDITARKIDEEQRETLVAELDHRVKNVLASVQSLAAQSARKASSLEGFLKTFSGRLKSMASAHQLLTATRWRGAGMLNIAAAELGGLAPGQTRWEGPDIMLTPRAANALALALHELATNAVKFGALSTDAGGVEVDWRRLEDGGFSLNWVEHGGPRVAPPVRHGFGSTLLDKVTGRELGGEVRVDYPSEGVRAVIVAGPSAVAEPSPADAPAPVPPSDAPTVAGASAGEPLAEQAAQVRGLRVLIVEDALLLALELEAGLQEAGAVVVGSAADLDEALGMVDLPIDAAVLDANLNGVSVLPVAEALAARGVPFVFATGYGDNKLGPQGFDAPVIRKPYDVTQVAAALAEVTGRI